jgi:hypothetical protein
MAKVREYSLTIRRTAQPRQFESLQVELTEHHEVRKDYESERDAAADALGKAVDKIVKRELRRALKTNQER